MITIDMLSVGDKILWCGTEMTVSQTMIDIIKASEFDLMQYVKRVPCTPENTKAGDRVYLNNIDKVSDTLLKQHHFDNKSVFGYCSIPLFKELSEHLAKQKPKEYNSQEAWKMMLAGYVMHRIGAKNNNGGKLFYWAVNGELWYEYFNGRPESLKCVAINSPVYADDKWVVESEPKPTPLFADVAVGDLVRFSNGQVEEVDRIFNDYFGTVEEVNRYYCFSISDGYQADGYPCKYHATELIKKGSADWGWEMMLKGNCVSNPKEMGYYNIFNNVAVLHVNAPIDGHTYFKNQWLENFVQTGWKLYEPQQEAKPTEYVKQSKEWRDGYKTAKNLWKAKLTPAFEKGYAKGVADMQAKIKEVLK